MKKNLFCSGVNSHFKLQLALLLVAFNLALLQANTATNTPHSKVSETPLKARENTLNLQQRNLQGTIVDEDGLPLVGASVIQKGTSHGTQSDFDGKFSLSIPKKSTILVVSYVGYFSQEVTVTSSTNKLEIVLKKDVSSLDEVVIVGYGTQKKTNLTGAVVDINISKDIGDRPVPNITSMLQGVLPGVSIGTNNSGGEPGATLSLNIRGAGTLTGNGGTPYILVDGFPLSASELNTLNPEDIENVSVLKDAASAAIYGSKGAYGVILITTKSGRKNTPFKVQYSSNYQISSPTILPEMMSSIDMATMINRAQENSGQTPWFSAEGLQLIRDYAAGKIPNEATPNKAGNRWANYGEAYANNDWYQIMFKDNAPRMTHNLSVSGGEKKTTYFLSGSIFDQEGQLRYGNNAYKRTNLTANITTQAKDWLRFNAIARYTKEVKDFPSGGFGNYTKDIIYHQTSRQFPVTPVYSPDGKVISANIARVRDAGKEENITNTSFFSFSTDFEPIKDWVTRVNYSKKITGSTTDRQEFNALIAHPDGSFQNVGYAPTAIEKVSRTGESDLFNIVSTLTKTISEDHNIQVLLGYESRFSKYWNLSGSRTQLLTENIPTISTAVGDFESGDALGENTTEGIFSRFSYNFREKYFLEINARADGSSYFSDGNRWGFFPSASASYVISKEPYFEALSKTVNLLKLRASWGQLGNHDPRLANNYVEILGKGRSDWLLNGQRINFITPPAIVSKDLTWETVTSKNIGVDIGLFENRFNATFDLYERVTSDMIGPSAAVPAVLGTNPPRLNNAELSTKGWELGVKWRDRIGEVNYFVGFNLFDNYSTITKYANPSGTLSTWREGQRLGDIWGYKTIGYFKTDEAARGAAITTADKPAGDVSVPSQTAINSRWGAGDIQYADLDGSGAIDPGDNTLSNPGDRRIIGNNRARYNYGINFGGDYKGFNLSVLFQGVGKRDFAFGSGTNLFWNLTGGTWQNSYTTAAQDYWTPEHPNAYFPKPYFTGEHRKNTRTQTKYLQNAAYLRLKNVQLGYTLPQKILDKIGFFNSLNVYVSGDNLWTKTKLNKNFDPETLGGGFGNGKIYPPSKVYSFGVKIGF